MLIDTHCHLDFKDFDSDRDAALARAKAAGVERIINVGSSLEGSRRSAWFAAKHAEVYASVGIHPHDAKNATDAAIDEIRRLAADEKVVAIGEVGLDYYRNLSPKEAQIDAFKKFISISAEMDLPLIIHARESHDDIIKILGDTGKRVAGVMHCFSGDERFLKSCLDLGLYISFTCNLTYKKSESLRDVAKIVPVERLLLETDAPYLAPEGMRGKRNEPANIPLLAARLSDLTGLSVKDIARITTHNANTLFGLGLDDLSKLAYEIRDSLYLNITNRCTNDCNFCVRNTTEFVKGHNLKLDAEPSEADILKAVGDPGRYKEIVFCGYGEPTLRLGLIKSVSGELKKRGAKIRVVTNGHGDIINSRSIAPELKGLVDRVSVSLNTDTEKAYVDACKPEFGPRAYKAIIEFIKACVKSGIEVEITCLDLAGVDRAKCEEMAKSLGANFRARHIGVVG